MKKEFIIGLLALVFIAATGFNMNEITGALIATSGGSFDVQDFPPVIESVSEFIGDSGDLVNIPVNAYDPNGENVTINYSSPLNSSGKWQSTINDSGIHYANIAASDGTLQTIRTIAIKLRPYCSDGICNYNDTDESCSTCPEDCGPCPPSPRVGGGGGSRWTPPVISTNISTEPEPITEIVLPVIKTEAKEEIKEEKPGIFTPVEKVKEKVIGKAIEVLPENKPNPYYIVPAILLLITLTAIISLRKSTMNKKIKILVSVLHVMLIFVIAALLIASFMDAPITGLANLQNLEAPEVYKKIKDNPLAIATAAAAGVFAIFASLMLLLGKIIGRIRRPLNYYYWLPTRNLAAGGNIMKFVDYKPEYQTVEGTKMPIFILEGIINNTKGEYILPVWNIINIEELMAKLGRNAENWKKFKFKIDRFNDMVHLEAFRSARKK